MGSQAEFWEEEKKHTGSPLGREFFKLLSALLSKQDCELRGKSKC